MMPDDCPRVSIVLPTYNGARYLDQAVQSCLGQLLRQWELIVVDDASTDETPLKIRSYVELDARVRSIHHTVRRRLPAALNTGFACARGRYFTWTSDDNCYRPEALAAMAEFLDANPDTAMVYADFSKIDDAGREVGVVQVGKPADLITRNCVGSCFLYRKEVHSRLGSYREDTYLAEDYEYWLRVSAHFRMRRLPRNLYCHRLHDHSLTAQHQHDVYCAADRALERHLAGLPWASREMKALTFLRLARRSKSRGEWMRMGRQVVRAFLYSPWRLFAQIQEFRIRL